MADEKVRTATFAELDAYTLYALLRLRVDVFVVEQECAYPELDGLDTAAGTVHLWLERAGEPVAYLRILDQPDGWCRIGRVAVAKHARGDRLAGRLMDAALARIGDHPSLLHAQSYLVEFYRRYGFAVSGPEYLDDGIPHTPMVHTTDPPATGSQPTEPAATGP